MTVRHILAGKVEVYRSSLLQALGTLATLFKLRVVALLLFAAAGGAFLGAHGAPSAASLIILLITGTLAAGGASAINQVIERNQDRLMKRTRHRPLADGTLENPLLILAISIAMVTASCALVFPSNAPMALYLLMGALVYVGIYTLWLKPRSVLNIVIGGAAGSFAVMTGGAAVGAATDPAVIVLALLVFLWTPAHFWALAMAYREDYAAAHVPMLPVHASSAATPWWIFIHAASTAFAAVALAVQSDLGWPYLIIAVISGTALLLDSVRLIQMPTVKRAFRLFMTSNLFLSVIVLAIILVTAAHRLISG